MATAIAAELDGVDADEIADALQVAEDKMRAAFEDGDMPDPDLFAQTLADELGVSKDDVTKALEASREKAFEAHGADAPGAPADRWPRRTGHARWLRPPAWCGRRLRLELGRSATPTRDITPASAPHPSQSRRRKNTHASPLPQDAVEPEGRPLSPSAGLRPFWPGPAQVGTLGP